MPIVVRRGRAIAEPRSRLLRFERPSVAVAATTAIRTTDLAAPDARHELARLALDLVVRTAEPADLPPRWSRPAFAREVDLTRAQLAPIRSRDALLASFSREASIAATRVTTMLTDPLGVSRTTATLVGPVRVAYAIRWLELGDGRSRPAWRSFVAGPFELVAGAVAGIVGIARIAPAAAADQRKGEITT